MYVKVFEQILDSSIADNYEVRHFFEDMLKLADKTGAVDMTPEAIHRRLNLPLEKVDRLLLELGKPDPRSRTPAHDGKRIIPLDSHRSWGWLIVNYEHYRNIRDQDARRAYNRDAQRRSREKRGLGKKVKAAKNNGAPSPPAPARDPEQESWDKAQEVGRSAPPDAEVRRDIALEVHNLMGPAPHCPTCGYSETWAVEGCTGNHPAEMPQLEAPTI